MVLPFPLAPLPVDGFVEVGVLHGHALALHAPFAFAARRAVRPGHVLRSAAVGLTSGRGAPETGARRLEGHSLYSRTIRYF